MNRFWKIFLLVLAVTAALYAAAVKFIAPQYLAQVPELVKTMSQNYINGTVTVERFDWNGRLQFTAYGLQVSGTDGERIAQVPGGEIFRFAFAGSCCACTRSVGYRTGAPAAVFKNERQR